MAWWEALLPKTKIREFPGDPVGSHKPHGKAKEKIQESLTTLVVP